MVLGQGFGQAQGLAGQAFGQQQGLAGLVPQLIRTRYSGLWSSGRTRTSTGSGRSRCK